MKKISYATQIWPFREDFGRDMPRTFERLDQIGFTGVELCRWFDWTDLFDKWTAKEISETSKQLGLEIISAHVPYTMVQEERLDELVGFCQVVGMQFAVVASLPERIYSLKENMWDVATTFNKAATALKPSGIRVGYHCHGGDFVPVEGVIPWEGIFDNTTPDVVMQLDIGNTLQGGADPLYYLKKYPGKATLVHLKDYHPQIPPAAIGDGIVDWIEVLNLCQALHQPAWYIIEQEEPEYDPWDCAERSLEYLHALSW